MAGKVKGNMFSAAAQKRLQEQQSIEAVITNSAGLDAGRFRKRGPDATTMTLAISKKDKQCVKAWAARHSTTVSDLLHNWIEEYCTD